MSSSSLVSVVIIFLNAEKFIVEQSLSLVTSLAPRIGYDRAAEIAREAYRTGRTIRELCRERQVLPPDELEQALDPWSQTEGGRV
jgi:fumarate hydratase, class II